MGEAWREPGTGQSWPVLRSEDDRWATRAAIDAVVADAFGLSRQLYVHVLSAFTHKNYQKAPELCLEAFDELRAVGLDAFAKKHDPYWDVPLVTTPARPEVAVRGQESSASGAFQLEPAEAKPRRGRPKKTGVA